MDEGVTTGDRPELFQVEGRISEGDVIFLEEVSGISSVRNVHGEVVIPFRSSSHISIGEPIVLPLAQILTQQSTAVPVDIRLQMQDYEFYQVQLACSFQAAQGCRFHEASFALALQTVTTDPSASAQGIGRQAIAYDLFPLKLEDDIKVTLKRSFNPEIKFTFDPIAASLTLPFSDRSEEYVAYKTCVVAYDLQGTQPKWTFTHTLSHEIDGPQKLFMIVRKPKGTKVNVTFSLTASVQFVLGKLALDPTPLVLLFRKGSPHLAIADPTVPLC